MTYDLNKNSNSTFSPRICIIGAGILIKEKFAIWPFSEVVTIWNAKSLLCGLLSPVLQFSGMCAAIRLQKDLDLHNFEIFDINKDVGGTWYSSTYPGCACDVPIHAYCYTFEKRADWSRQYADQQEILIYLKEIARKYDLHSKIKFEHCIRKLVWREDKWNATIEDLQQKGTVFEKDYDLVINATGFLRVPKIPDEFTNFKGPVMHTATWDHSIDLKDKKVAVIGIGASGVQVIPQISKLAQKLLVFQRKPPWIVPKFDAKFLPVVKWIFRYIPFVLIIYHFVMFYILEAQWYVLKKGSWAAKQGTKICNWHRGRQLKSYPELYEKLTPNYDLGCKRVCASSNFYPSFTNPATELVTSSILKVSADSIYTLKHSLQVEHKIDVLVLATGYEVTEYFAPMEIFDKNGENLRIKWKRETPSLLLGISSNSLPNMFILYGPNTSTGHNSVVRTVEIQVDWIIKCLRQMKRQKANVFSIKEDAEELYMKEIREKFEEMVWSASVCDPWYTDELGRNISMYPGSLKSLEKRVKKFDFNKVEFHSRLDCYDSV